MQQTAGLPDSRPGIQDRDIGQQVLLWSRVAMRVPGRVQPGLAPHLVLVQGVVLQPVHLQQFLGHPNAGQVCEDAEVAGNPEAYRRGAGWVGSEPSSLGWRGFGGQTRTSLSLPEGCESCHRWRAEESGL